MSRVPPPKFKAIPLSELKTEPVPLQASAKQTMLQGSVEAFSKDKKPDEPCATCGKGKDPDPQDNQTPPQTPPLLPGQGIPAPTGNVPPLQPRIEVNVHIPPPLIPILNVTVPRPPAGKFGSRTPTPDTVQTNTPGPPGLKGNVTDPNIITEVTGGDPKLNPDDPKLAPTQPDKSPTLNTGVNKDYKKDCWGNITAANLPFGKADFMPAALEE